MKAHFIIIGLDDSKETHFLPEVSEYIRKGRFFSGGIRHREIVKDLLPADAEWIPITVPLDKVFTEYRKVFAHGQPSIIVFASGDPLFFGFANTIRREMPDADIKLYPFFNSLQLLAHRLLMPYDDMRTVSLTGRPWQEFDRALIERAPKLGILTDRTHTPVTIAKRMLEYGYDYYTMYVGECLGNPEKERVRQMTLHEAVSVEFQHPNNLLLVRTYEQSTGRNTSNCRTIENSDQRNIEDSSSNRVFSARPFGIPDEDFTLLDGRKRMITKSPIRLLTLQALELNRKQVFWDIGFCTGSVSIEARLLFPHLTVVAFEIRPEGEKLMATNSHRFGAPGITTIIGDFMEMDITALSPPDAVFIGGHGGQLAAILERIRQILLPEGCVVFNSVSDSSREIFREVAIQTGFSLDTPLNITVNDYNPIEIMKAYIL